MIPCPDDRGRALTRSVSPANTGVCRENGSWRGGVIMVSKVVKLGLCMATLAALWIATPEAQAQRRGGRGGGWGGWGGGGWSSPGVYVGPGGVGVDFGRDGYYRDGYYGDRYYGNRYYGDGFYGD